MAAAGNAFDNARESIYCEGEFKSLGGGREGGRDEGRDEGGREGGWEGRSEVKAQEVRRLAD